MNPQRVFETSTKIMENVAKRGGVDAVCIDIKENFGIDVDPKVVQAIMACGGTIILMTMGQAIGVGALKVDKDRLEEVLDQEKQAADLKSAEENDKPITLEAERAASEALARIRKLH